MLIRKLQMIRSEQGIADRNKTVLFSIITYISASKVIDFIVYGLEELAGILIFSSQYESLKNILIHEGDVGVSLLNGRAGLSETELHNEFCVPPKTGSGGIFFRLLPSRRGIDN